MKDNIIGKLKSYLLFFLLILAFVQAGILWSGETQRISFNYINKIFVEYSKGKTNGDDIGYEKYLRPDKLIVGSSDGHFLIKDNYDKYEDVFWSVIENLKYVFEKSQPEKIDNEIWQESLGGDAIYFFYSSEIPIELFNNVFGIENNFITINNIQKVAIYVLNDKDSNEIAILLKSNKEVYKYLSQDRNDVTKLINNVIVEKEYSYDFYSGMLIDLFKSKIVTIGEAEILYNDKEPIIREYNIYDISPIPIDNDSQAFFKVLLDEKEYLFEETIYENYIEYINSRNLYRVNLNNLNVENVEYKYIGDNDSGKTEIITSFSKAVQILEKFREYESKITEFYLDSIEETVNGYIFKFAYIINGEKLISQLNEYDDVATIVVEGDKVIEFNIQLLGYQKEKTEQYYQDYALLFNTGIKKNDIFIKDIEIINYFGNIDELSVPKWRVKFEDTSSNYYELMQGN